MNSYEAVAQAINILQQNLPLPGDWRWEVRDDGGHLWWYLVSPRYPNGILFSDSTVYDGNYDAAINYLSYLMGYNRNLPNMVTEKIQVIEGQISIEELRRQKAMQAEEERRRREAEAAAAARAEEERRQREQEALATDVCCPLIAVGGPITVGTPLPPPIPVPVAPSPPDIFVGQVPVSMPKVGGIFAAQPPVPTGLPAKKLDEVEEEAGQVNPLLILGLLLLLILMIYLWS